ncbi:hypothetical protein T492DRAFT_887745, partial [Pavlovales sp. CCMP2436]
MGAGKTKASSRLGFETFRVFAAQKLEAGSCAELTLEIVHGHTFSEAAPWALEQVESLTSKVLLAKQHHSVPPNADADGFTLVVDKKARKCRAKLFADLVRRWLHAPLHARGRVENAPPPQLAKPAGEEVGEGGSSGDDSDGGAQRQAEAEEAVEVERERRAELREGEGEQGGEAFNLRAMEAALAAAAAGGGNEGGPRRAVPAPVARADEGEFSDDDEPGGGPARTAARRGQAMLSEAQLHDVRDAHGHEVVLRCSAEYRDLCRKLVALHNQRDGAILCKARVIGLTTTGTAKNRALLETVAPAVLIVEEAAE